MKSLVLILLLSMVACGKNHTGPSSTSQVFREELSQRPTEYARDQWEVQQILREAAQGGFLEEFNNTRWLTHRGAFLCRSVVLDAQSFRLDYAPNN